MRTSAVLLSLGFVLVYADWSRWGGLAMLGFVLFICGGVKLALSLSDWLDWELR